MNSIVHLTRGISVIAECAFQHARAAAFVTGIGVQKLAMSYLGLDR